MRVSGPRIGGSRIALLVVERDCGEALSIERMLPRGPGGTFDVCSVGGVEAGLRALQEERFDGLILDLDTGEDQGIEALLRARIATETLPVVVVSDDEDDSLALRALRLGAQDYIVKSELSRHLVTRTVLHAVERHRLLRDLTQARQREHFLATHDALTELPNRFSLEEFLTRSVASARRSGSQVAVLFLDLDGFKAVNDTLGHAAGDELLRQTASRLLGCVRRSDMVARLGGDEFILALTGVGGVQGAIDTARKVSEQVVLPFSVCSQECWVTPSLGVAMFPDDAQDAESLVRCADLAMYEAKRRGPNQIRLHQQGSGEELSDRFRLVHGLRKAIASGELQLHFQPQIELHSGRAVVAEALPRWLHRAEGWVSPRVFIPIAEQSGMAGPIGDWVLRSACVAALGWDASLAVALNVSSVQLCEPDFAERSLGILHETGLPPQRLELELAESSFAAREAAISENLLQLRQRGVRVVVDDFGTGTSSLSLLRELPVDAVKLDESVVQGSPGDPRDRVIVGGLVQMIRGLGMEAVAEGVESSEQLRLLHQLGCRRAQGYLLAKPCPEEDLTRDLRERPWLAEIEQLRD